jgi:BirA family biotin operon repressor/biotin-[acetyl-CoA-carboxylase] ligase
MTNKDKVLQALSRADGYISGQDLADDLGVSRHAVWKAIESLRAEGLDIEAATRRGYRLVHAEGGGLSAAAIAAALADQDGWHVDYKKEVDSTNNWARDLAEAGAEAWTVLVADRQTAGRGRMGRSFYSPKATGLYMSVIVRPDCEAAQAGLLTVAAAQATAEGLEQVFGKEVGIKWVNDCYIDGRKVSGILTEASLGLEEARLRYAVIGIGINVAPPAGGWPEDVADRAGTVLDRLPQEDPRAALAAAVLRPLRAYVTDLDKRAYLPAYRSRMLVMDRDVVLIRGKEKARVHVTGLDQDAALLVVDQAGNERRVASGEVSLRLDEKEIL